MSKYDYLDIGTIWKSKRRGTLSRVIALANFDLPEKYQKTNPPQVVFVDNITNNIFASTVDRFLSLRNFVRRDDEAKEALYDFYVSPILEEEDPSLYLDDESEDDDDLLITSDDDENEEDKPQAMQPYAISAAASEEEPKSTKVEASTKTETQFKLAIETDQSNSELEQLINSSFVSYDQFRSIDSVFYHKLTFNTAEAVQSIIDNADDIHKMSVIIGNVSVPINVDYITTVYTSANKIENGMQVMYNIIVAEQSEEENEENDSTTDVPAAEAQPTASSSDEAHATTSNVESSDDAREDAVSASTDTSEVVSEPSDGIREEHEEESNSATTSSELIHEKDPEVEEISINAHQDDEDLEEENVEDIADEATIDDSDEEENVEALPSDEEQQALEDAKLLQESLIMPSSDDEIEDVQEIKKDEVAESLANKLEASLENTTEETSEEAVKEEDKKTE